jgi:amino acid transporter
MEIKNLLNQTQRCSMVKSQMLAEIKKSKIGMLGVVALIYSYTSGGLFGLEDMLSSCGPGLAFLLILLLPIFWATPMSLVSAELNSMYPEDGGIYVWVTKAMGEFMGFLTGWWYSLCVLVDTAVYLVLISSYLQFMADRFGPEARMALILLIVVGVAIINLRGTGAVSVSTMVFTIIVLSPFAISTAMGISQWQVNPFEPFIAEGQTATESVAYGIMVGMWMYCGYEAIGSVAEEIEGAYHKIPKALMICLGITSLTYLIPTLTGYAAVGGWESWAAESTSDETINFITMGFMLGGGALGGAFLISAIFSSLICYNSYTGAGSRVPFAMARNNLFFKSISTLNHRWGTPHVAILASSVVTFSLSFFNFDFLVTTVMTLYLVSVILFLLAVLVLRIKAPNAHRPYRIPVGTFGVGCLIALPIALIIWTLWTSDWETLAAGGIGLASGPVAYLFFKKFYGGRTKVELSAADVQESRS